MNQRLRKLIFHLFALPLAPVASIASGPTGLFVDINASNTSATDGSPHPFFTDDARGPDFTDGDRWRRREGLGFNITGHREIFERNANGGFGPATPLVTTVEGLTPGAAVGVFVAFLSVPTEDWRVRAGLSSDGLTLFTPRLPARRTIDLGRSAEPSSNRNQYLGFIGNATVPPDGSLQIYSADGGGAAADFSERTWLEGFLVAESFTPPPLPGGAAEIAPDGAWTWFNDERAIIHHGAIFAGYVRSDGHYGVTRYNLADGKASHATISTGVSAQRDDHNNPSLAALPDGRLLALYSKHHAENHFYQRVSKISRPASDADWEPEIARPAPAKNTYANTYLLTKGGNRIYNFHRSIDFNPTLTISPDLGESWNASLHFIAAGPGVRPYTRFASNGHDRIDLLYTDGHPRDVANSVYHLFYRDGTFRRTDGEVIKSIADLPLDHSAGERGSIVYHYREDAWKPGDGPDDWIPHGHAWNWDIHYGRDGHPVAAFQVRVADVTGSGWNHNRIYYYYARWTGSSWQRRFIAHAGRPLYPAEGDYAGGMAIDPDDPRVVYISSNAADPFALDDLSNVPLRPNDRYELWRGVTRDGGLSFSWTQLTFDSPADNLRPIVPENHDLTECLLWLYGTYNSYTDYTTQVIGRIGKPGTSLAD